MRILLTTDTIGGVWTFTRELSTGLLRAGHSVALVSLGRAPSRSQSAWCSAMEMAYDGNFFYEGLTEPLEWMPENAAAFRSVVPRLLRVADRFSPDLIHSSQFCFGCLPVSIPRIITAHSDVLSWAAACRPHGLMPSRWLVRYRHLVQRGLDAATAVVAPSQWMMNALCAGFEVGRNRHTIFNGRTLESVRGDEHRVLRAITAGRLWDEAKNLAILARIHSPITILVAGDSCCAGAVAPKLPPPITLLGQLSDDDLLARFRTSSIYLATPIYEPFGLAPLEAALCGCAVVANDIPSFREIWADAALYFDSPEALEHVLSQLSTSPNLLCRMRDRSLHRALQLTQSRMTEAYVALYSRFLRTTTQQSTREVPAYA